MKLITVFGHSVDVSRLLPAPAKVLDAGCRDFEFANAMTTMFGAKVLTLDADASVRPDIHAALVGDNCPSRAWYVAAEEAGRIVFEENLTLQEVPTITIRDLVRKHGTFDLVKMDIEGSEYDVLLTWPGPVAGQISVEFHEPTGQGMAKHGADVYARILQHLSQWYDLVKHDATPYPGGVNYYDSVFVLKG